MREEHQGLPAVQNECDRHEQDDGQHVEERDNAFGGRNVTIHDRTR